MWAAVILPQRMPGAYKGISMQQRQPLAKGCGNSSCFEMNDLNFMLRIEKSVDSKKY